MGRVLKALLVGLLTLAAFAGWRYKGVPFERIEDESIDRMLEWLEAGGGKLGGATVGRACATCPRGLIATRPMFEGEGVLKVPVELALPVTVGEVQPETNPQAAQLARDLFIRLHSDPSFNATWGPYLATLPPPGTQLRAELMGEDQLALLQHDELAKAARAWRHTAEQVWDGTFNVSADSTPLPALPTVLPEGSGATLDGFKHLISVALSRAFTPVVNEEQGVDLKSPWLLPLADLVNFSRQPNAGYMFINGSCYVVMLKGCRRGEEITFAAESEFGHRPDGTLLLYGYVEATDSPLLASVDVPEGYDAHQDSDPYSDPGSPFMSHDEAARLKGILKTLPTTEQEDEALLESGVLADWRDRLVVQFRIQRKKALRLALAQVKAVLEERRAAAAAAGSLRALDGEDDDIEWVIEDDEKGAAAGKRATDDGDEAADANEEL